MTDDHATETIVVVDVIVTVDVGDVTATAALKVDGIRIAGLERGSNAKRHGPTRPVVKSGGLRGSLAISRQLIGEQPFGAPIDLTG
jgi:hypothetical protein